MKLHIAYRISHIAEGLFLCLLSAILLIVSFPNFNLWLCAWVGFVPLFFALQNKSKTKAFLLSYFTGVIFWSGVIYWLIHVTLPGTILLILYLALYFGFFGLIIYNYEPRTMNYELLFIPSIWVLLEYIRSHLFTGFPWALLGYSQYLNLSVIQIADITGVWGISFVMMLANVTFYLFFSKKRKYPLFLLCILIIFILRYGIQKELKYGLQAMKTNVKISVIQANIPQELKWNAKNNEFIMNKYIELTEQAIREHPDLIIWPEAALPVVLEEEPIFFERVKGLAREIRTSLLLGAVTLRNGLYYNSAVLVSSEGEVLNRYDKIHLVPFGEYIPLKKYLPFLETVVPIGDIAAGREHAIFEIPNSKLKNTYSFSALICFEDLFPELSRKFVKKGASFLVNVTNDAWYKKTSAPYQHLQASVFRAVENRRFLVRAANTGVSGFILPNGHFTLVRDKSNNNIFIEGFYTMDICAFLGGPTFYVRYGDIFIIVCLIFIFYGIIPKFKITMQTKQ